MIRGLYAITPDEADTQVLLAKVRQALAGGTRLLQYRNKLAGPSLKREQAAALATLCRAHGMVFIVNDDLALALEVGAQGVHMGSDDGDLAAARRVLGPDRLLGASCYNRLDLALAARTAGASYVAFGAAYASGTKPGAVHAPLELYRQAHAEVGLPIVAIGGISRHNAPELIGAGVAAVAVITAVFNAPDVEKAAREFAALFVVPSNDEP